MFPENIHKSLWRIIGNFKGTGGGGEVLKTKKYEGKLKFPEGSEGVKPFFSGWHTVRIVSVLA